MYMRILVAYNAQTNESLHSIELNSSDKILFLKCDEKEANVSCGSNSTMQHEAYSYTKNLVKRKFHILMK